MHKHDYDTICAICGKRYGAHRSADDKCPLETDDWENRWHSETWFSLAKPKVKKKNPDKKNIVRKWVCKDCGKYVPCTIKIEDTQIIPSPYIIENNQCLYNEEDEANWKEK